MATPAGTDANKDLVRAYTQTVFNDHHTDRAAEFLARDVTWHGGTLGTMDGVDNVAALVRGIIEALPDLTATEQDIIAEGDTVAVRYVVEATHTGTCSGSRRRAAACAGTPSTSIASPTARSSRNGPATTCWPFSSTWGRTPRRGWAEDHDH